MGEPAFAHHVVRLDGAVHVVLVDAHGDAHQHLLGTLGDLAFNLQQVRTLQRLEAEEIVAEVTVVDDARVEQLGILLDDFPNILRDQARVLSGDGIHVFVEVLHGLREGFLRRLVQVADRDAAGELGIVGMCHRIGGRDFGREVVQFGGGDAVVHPLDDAHGDFGGVNCVVQAVAQFLDAGCDLVKLDRFTPAIALQYIHARRGERRLMRRGWES